MPEDTSLTRRLSSPVRRLVRRVLATADLKLVPTEGGTEHDVSPEDAEILRDVAPYTMTTPASVVALVSAVRHVSAAGIPGAIVETGVWRGGSMRAVARTLRELDRQDVPLYLFDTFEGMVAPTDKDVAWTGESAEDLMRTETGKRAELLWARAPLDEVRRVLAETGYPAELLHFVIGLVEETIPEQAPDQIALLRLDTDWYASSKHELEHLYPRLSPGGILILDDYAWWDGVRMATDEYFAAHPPKPWLVRLDDSGARVAVKPGPVGRFD